MTKTVADLIAYLQTLPQDSEVSIMAEESRRGEMAVLKMWESLSRSMWIRHLPARRYLESDGQNNVIYILKKLVYNGEYHA